MEQIKSLFDATEIGQAISNHWVSRNSYRDNSASEEHCCECGCVFEVVVLEQEGHNEIEEYYCPDCHKEYKVRASFTPQVFKKAK